MYSEPTNSDRAHNARKALDVATDCNDPHTDVVDLLCNLRHYCDREGVDFGAADHSAYSTHYLAELAEERERAAMDETNASDAARWGIEGFWLAIGEHFPELPGDYQPGPDDDALSAAAQVVAAKWLEGKTSRPTWQARVARFAKLIEYHEVGTSYRHPAAADLPESRDFALVIEGHDSGENVIYSFDCFGELCEMAADCVLGSDALLAAYDLNTANPIPLHISTPVVSQSDDPGAVGPNPFDE